MTGHGVEPGGETAPTGRVKTETLNAERVRFLFRSPVAMLSNLGVAAVFAYAVREQVGVTLALGWLGLMAAIVAIRILIWFAYRRWAIGGSDYRRWALWYEISAGANGLAWAVPAVEVVSRAPTELMAVYATIIGVLLAGMVFAASVWTRAFVVFVLTTGVVPILLALIHPDSMHQAFGVLGTVYLGAILAWGRSAGRMFTETLQLRLENIMLAGDVAIAREHAREVEKARHEGFAGLSHELRTPLNAIVGFGQAVEAELWGSLGNPRYREYAHNIVHAGQHLEILINQALDLSRLETARTPLEETTVDLEQVAADCHALIADRAKQKGVALQMTVQPSLPKMRGDPAKLRQILINLLANAVKFTPERGTVTLSVALTREGDLELSVADTGVGIAPDDLERVLEPFVKGGQAMVRNTEGLGLGLALSRSLAELHDGTLMLESELGVGTTVRVSIPRSRLFRAR